MSVIYEALKKAQREAQTPEAYGHDWVEEFLLVAKHPSRFARSPIVRVALLVGALTTLAAIGAGLYYSRTIQETLVTYYFKKAAPTISQIAAWKQAAQVHYANGENEEAIALWKKVAAVSPADAVVRNRLGLAYKKLGNLDLAAHYYQSALGLDPRFVQAMNNWAVVLLEQGDIHRARPLFEAAGAQDARYADPYFHLGRLYEKEENVSQAIGAYREFLNRAPAAADPQVTDKIRARIAQLEAMK